MSYPGFLPAWSVDRPADVESLPSGPWPADLDCEWAWGGADGRGVRVCILDSGVDASHPRVGTLAGAYGVAVHEDGSATVEPDDGGDSSGHGTACAGIIRSLAPAARITSVKVLTSGITGAGSTLEAALRWVIEERFDVVNLSLSTRKPAIRDMLRELTDTAWFKGIVLVASAHNFPVLSFPWTFSSVISVSSHTAPDPWLHYYNPQPPAEFQAHGVGVEVAWAGGSSIRATGNSFAAPHVSALCALILSKHPGLTPFEVKTILRLTAANVGRRTDDPTRKEHAREHS
jgi:subtilisin family serine protease